MGPPRPASCKSFQQQRQDWQDWGPLILINAWYAYWYAPKHYRVRTADAHSETDYVYEFDLRCLIDLRYVRYILVVFLQKDHYP